MADNIVLEPVQDNSLFQTGSSLSAQRSQGAGDGVFFGVNNRGNLRRGLTQFDIAGNIPAGSVIENVRLVMEVTMSRETDIPTTLHTVLAAWGEGTSNGSGGGGGGGTGTIPVAPDATWYYRKFPTDLWTSPGGDFAPAVLATAIAPSVGVFAWESTPQLVSQIQAWLDDPSTNFGFLIRGDETGLANAFRVASREYSIATSRPKLEVTFDAPCDIDFNNDGVFPDLSDFVAFVLVYGAGECPTIKCDSIDFNRDEVFPDSQDITDFIATFGGGPCPY
jgi:hypothetical protein